MTQQADQSDVLVDDPNVVKPLGDDTPILSTVIITGRDANVGRPRIGIIGRMTGGVSGTGLRFSRDSVLTLESGTRLSQWGITGGSAGDGVTIMHGGPR